MSENKLICTQCGQDHVLPLVFWCDRSGFEIKYDKLRAKLELAVNALEKIDKHLCERIIDPCGFDPKKESRNDLITLVIGLSGDNDIILNELRQTLAKIKGGAE